MIIAGIYSFNGGREIIELEHPTELTEIQTIVRSIDPLPHKTKISKEKTMIGQTLFSPSSLNKAFKQAFAAKDWVTHRVACEYPTQFYTAEYQPPAVQKKKPQPFREIDFVKNALGVEVQFGKYAFMVYNVAAKMTIFHNLGIIRVGVEIVPVKAFAEEMSTGVSYFEQFVWDLEHRGTSNIDIPVLVMGVMY